jgi:hypothetical protein
MPVTFTHSPAETERKEPGIGGKPPLDRRPTGGGGGGGDDDRQHERHGPRELLHKIRFSVFSILAADMMFFAILVALFFARQAGTHMDPRTHEQIGDWHPEHGYPSFKQLDHRSCAPEHFPRDRCSGGMAGTRSSSTSAHPAVDGRDPRTGSVVSRRAVGCLEATHGAGVLVRSLVHASELLLLHHYRAACRALDRRCRRPCGCTCCYSSSEAGRTPPDRSRRSCMVLARHGRCVDGSFCSPCHWAVIQA